LGGDCSLCSLKKVKFRASVVCSFLNWGKCAYSIRVLLLQKLNPISAVVELEAVGCAKLLWLIIKRLFLFFWD